MFYLKFILLFGSFLVAVTLVVSTVMNLIDAWNAPYHLKTVGTVIQDIPFAGSPSEPIAPGGGQVTVEFKDSSGQLRKEVFSRFNSGGKTEFSDKQVGDSVEFQLKINEPVEGAVKSFRWNDVSIVLLMFGGLLALAGAVLRFL